MNIKRILIVGFVGITSLVTAQNSELDSLIQNNRFEIYQDENGFSGSGMDFLIRETKNAQFVAIGENHNTKEIPEFTEFLFEQLNQRYNFQYLVLEQDPIMMQLIHSSNAEELAKEYPNGFTFVSDQEIKMISKVKNVSSVKNSVWGCDQSFGANHALMEMTRDITPNQMDKIWKDVFYIDSIESSRNLEHYHFMGDMNKRKQLQKIQSVMWDSLSEIEREYFDLLLLSDSIFTMMQNGQAFEARILRENFMREQFLKNYWEESNQVGHELKAILKFGHYHLMKGFNTGSNTLSLGNLVTNLAEINDKEALLINTQIFRADGSDWDYLNEALPEITKHASLDSWTLFDLRPLRKHLSSNGNQGLLQKMAFEFDVLLVIGNGGDGTWKISGAPF